MRPYTEQVKKYWLKYTIDNQEYEHFILAINSDNALSMLNRTTDYETVTLRRLTDVIGMAQYSARVITDDPSIEFSLNYHCKPVKVQP